ncbi:MAG: response regulator transcription factor [Chloroflexi bacterium]|nr:response regulator transcription factor [Chloroflexota bacterium]
MHTLLVIDDDPLWVANIRDKLEHQGFRIVHTTNPREGLELARANPPDIIILDLLFPHQPHQGEDILMELKHDPRTRNIPIVVYSIKGRDRATRELISRYSPAPIVLREQAQPGAIVIGNKWEMLELQNVVFNLVGESNQSRVIRVGECTLELGDGYRSVRVNGREIKLTRRDSELLAALDKHRGTPLNARALKKELSSDLASDDEPIREGIHAMRKKIEPDPNHPIFILTERNFGYLLTKGTSA